MQTYLYPNQVRRLPFLSRKLVIGKWESYNYEEESLRGVDLFKMNKRNPLETVTRNATFANPRIRVFNADAII